MATGRKVTRSDSAGVLRPCIDALNCDLLDALAKFRREERSTAEIRREWPDRRPLRRRDQRDSERRARLRPGDERPPASGSTAGQLSGPSSCGTPAGPSRPRRPRPQHRPASGRSEPRGSLGEGDPGGADLLTLIHGSTRLGARREPRASVRGRSTWAIRVATSQDRKARPIRLHGPSRGRPGDRGRRRRDPRRCRRPRPRPPRPSPAAAERRSARRRRPSRRRRASSSVTTR